MQLLDMSFDFITALHDFEELFGPTARSIMLCWKKHDGSVRARKNQERFSKVRTVRPDV